MASRSLDKMKTHDDLLSLELRCRETQDTKRRLRLLLRAAATGRATCWIRRCPLGQLPQTVAEGTTTAESERQTPRGGRREPVGNGTRTKRASNLVEKGTLQETVKEEVSEWPSVTAMSLMAPAIIGADDNQTRVKETGAAEVSRNSLKRQS